MIMCWLRYLFLTLEGQGVRDFRSSDRASKRQNIRRRLRRLKDLPQALVFQTGHRHNQNTIAAPVSILSAGNHHQKRRFAHFIFVNPVF